MTLPFFGLMWTSWGQGNCSVSYGDVWGGVLAWGWVTDDWDFDWAA